jgi:hypothetical protein
MFSPQELDSLDRTPRRGEVASIILAVFFITAGEPNGLEETLQGMMGLVKPG